MSDDHSAGDARKPYSDRGGPQGRHAETHDVRREELTNPSGPEPVDESFAEDIAPSTPDTIREAQGESMAAGEDKNVIDALPNLTQDQLAELAVLPPGTPLEQGAVYLNLSHRERGEFRAMGGTEVGEKDRIVAKKATDHELWGTLTGTRHDGA